MFLGAVTIAAAAGVNAGGGNQEAFQFLMNGRTVGDAASHVLVFVIPLVARGERPSWTVRLAAVSGFGTTLLFVVLSVFPFAWWGAVGGVQIAGPAVLAAGETGRQSESVDR
jgi:hypothetical protein